MKVSEIHFRRLFIDYFTKEELDLLVKKYVHHEDIKFENLFLKEIDEKSLEEIRQHIIAKKLSENKLSIIEENIF